MLLEALEQPQRSGRIRSAALTSFLGWSAHRLATAGEDAVDGLGVQLRRWSDLLAGQGVAALLETMSVTEDLPARVLAGIDGERRMTDLRHVGQALHEAAVEGGLGISALVSWLRRRRGEAGEDVTEERSRRLDSDAEAVQVVTVHRAKGLEFPVVYVPFGWDAYRPEKPQTVQCHADDGTRVLDVGGVSGPEYARHRDRWNQEEDGEALRLLYVALTRARHQAVAWWVPATTAQGSPLNRLLFGRGSPGTEPAARPVLRPDADARAVLDGLSRQAHGLLRIEDALPDPAARWEPPGPERGVLHAARFTRRLDQRWRRTSYTALTADGHAPASGSHGAVGRAGRGQRAGGRGAYRRAGRCAAVVVAGRRRGRPHRRRNGAAAQRPLHPWPGLPAGTAFGTLVHAVLEQVDFAASDLPAELAARVGEQLGRRPDPRIEPAQLVAGTARSDRDPAGRDGGRPAAARRARGGPAGRTGLRVAAGRRRRGRPPRCPPSLRARIPPCRASLRSMRRHLDRGDPLAGYPDRLAALAASGQGLRGYLTGSLDAVLRLPGDDGRPGSSSWTTRQTGSGPGGWTGWPGRMGRPDAGPPGPGRRARRTDRRNQRAHRLALPARGPGGGHAVGALPACRRCCISWRCTGSCAGGSPATRPEAHLGGALYLFLRGMCGPDTPSVDGVRCGVFAWQPPPGLVVEVSDLFDRGAP